MNHDITILGLTGRAGSGKDTAANHLCGQYGFVRAAFAEPLKNMLEAMLEHAGLDHIWLHEPGFKNHPIPELGVSARQLMQTLGTEWGRNMVNTDLWITLLDRHLGITAGAPVHDRIVITDVRMPNEADWVKHHGGQLLRLVRDHTTPVRAHESEQYADTLPADCAIYNTGPTTTGLYSMLDGHMASLGLDRRDCLFREGY